MTDQFRPDDANGSSAPEDAALSDHTIDQPPRNGAADLEGEPLALDDPSGPRFPGHGWARQVLLSGSSNGQSVKAVEPRTPEARPSSEAVLPPHDLPERYQVLGAIARGGMGAVFQGRDVELGREIAVKVMLEAHQEEPELLRRFLKEAQIGGQLQHPGIVPVYELGRTRASRPYFTMKLVKGQTLAQLLKERAEAIGRCTVQDNGGAEDQPAVFPEGTTAERGAALPSLPPLARAGDYQGAVLDGRLLSIFEQVCQTMAYAHARRVIHRDLKPTNIMVGSFGEVQVMDWGLAKVLPKEVSAVASLQANGEAGEDAPVLAPECSGDSASPRSGLDDPTGLHTLAGSMLGTPAYMAPEQARGEIASLDERCDVFGLGAILCQILTGRPPYTGSTSSELRGKALRADLTEAWQRLADCDADTALLALARDCLAPDKEQRPRHAGAVAARLTAYLQSVQARLKQAEVDRAAAQARAEEERKRRRVWLTLVAALFVLMLGFGGAGWWYQQDQARQTTEKALQQQGAERDVVAALAQATAARQALHGQLARAGGVRRLLDEPARWKGQLKEVRLHLEAAQALLGQVGPGFDPELTRQVATLANELVQDEADQRLAMRLEQIRLDKSTFATARFQRDLTEQEYPKAFAGAGLPVLEGPPARVAALVRRSAIKEQLVTALDDWALVAQHKGRAKLQARLLDVARLAAPDRWQDQLRTAAAWQNPQIVRELAAKLLADRDALARLSPQTLDLIGAALCETRSGAAPWLRQAQALHPTDFWLSYRLAMELYAAHPAEAAGYARVALALRPHCAGAWNSFGLIQQAQKNLPGAVAAFHKALACDPSYAHYWNNLGIALDEQQDHKGAVAAFHKAVAIEPQFARAWSHIGNVLGGHGDFRGALAAHHKAVACVPPDAAAWNNLGAFLNDHKDRPAAVEAFQKAVTIEPHFALAWQNLGTSLRFQKDLTAARTALTKAVGYAPRNARAWNSLGSVLREQNDLDGAVTAYTQALQINPGLAEAHCNLGNTLRNLGRLAEAVQHLEKGHELGSRLPGWSEPSAKWLQICRLVQQEERRARAILQGDAKPRDASDLVLLGRLCQQCQHYRAAQRLFVAGYTAQPSLAEDPIHGYRYQAACAAVLAAAGRGQDVSQLEASEKAELRRQAREWLQADRKRLAQTLTNYLAASRTARDVEAPPTIGPADLVHVCDQLAHWLADPDLASVRADRNLNGYSPAEQQAWRQLWADVRALDKQIRSCFREQRLEGRLTSQCREQVHEIQFHAGKTYVIDMTSDQFDAFLRLHDNLGKKLAENDDVELGLILNSRLVFTASQDGWHRLVATSFEQQGTGDYTLLVRETNAKNP